MSKFNELAAEVRGRMTVTEIMMTTLIARTAENIEGAERERFIADIMAIVETTVDGLERDGTPDAQAAAVYARAFWKQQSDRMLKYVLARGDGFQA